MGLTVNTAAGIAGVSALIDGRTKKLNRTLGQLASGSRLVRAADGPADLVTLEQLNALVGGTGQAVVNAQRAAAVADTADGGLSHVSSLLNDIRGLLLEAGNTATSDEDALAAIQSQIDSSIDTIHRIAQDARYGETPLLDGSADLQFQIGAQAGQTVSLSLPSMQASDLATGVANGSGFGSLADLAVLTPAQTEDSLALVDQAIGEVAGARAAVGSFGATTVRTALNVLGADLRNLSRARSVLGDTDYTSATGAKQTHSVRLQVALQAVRMANESRGSFLSLLA
jgi:flagellin